MDDVGGITEGRFGIGRGADAGGQSNVGHVAGMAVVVVQLTGNFFRTDQQSDGNALASEDGGQGEAEVASAHYRHSDGVRRWRIAEAHGKGRGRAGGSGCSGGGGR